MNTDNIDHTQRAHSWLSPSGFAPVFDGECLGKPRMEKGLPEGPVKEATLRGTRIHELADLLRAGGVAKGAAPEEVQEALDFNEYCDLEFALSLKEDPNAVLEAETRVEVFEKYQVGGTGDIFILSKQVLKLIDLKTGRGFVSVEKNPQLLGYAVGKILSLQKNKQFVPPFVELHIYQPSIDNVAKWKTDTSWVLDWYITQTQKVQIARRLYDAPELPDIQYLKTNNYCVFCKAKTTCPAYVGELEETALVSFKDYSVPSPQTLSNEQLVRIQQAAPKLKSYLKAVEDILMQKLTAGEYVEGVTLKEGRSNRVWREDVDVAGVLEIAGIDPYEKKLIGITKAEKSLKKVNKGIMEGLTHKPPGKPKLSFTDSSLDMLEGMFVEEE